MAIATLEQYLSASKQYIQVRKTQTGATGTRLCSMWSATAGGMPDPGSFAVGNTANGLVPDNTTTGAFPISAYSGTAYLTGVEADAESVTNESASQYRLYDRLFHCGSYAFNASTTLASQPSYASRIPSGRYQDAQLWFECASAFTGQCTITVTYTDQSGNAGHTTGAVAIDTAGTPPALGRLFQLPLASGDCGVQMVESVTSTVASAGTFNIVVMRELWRGNLNASLLATSKCFGIDKCGFADLPSNACVMIAVLAPSYATEHYAVVEISTG